MSHLQARLQERNIEIDDSFLYLLAFSAQEDIAFVIKYLDCHKGSAEENYYARTESNGDMVVLVVRENKPITIMYRRKNQDNTRKGLRVGKFINLVSGEIS
jgi:hypothetical protein